ncbi:MAG: cyclic lactone autoinducer peptide [Lactobacillales bacterium]|nr:cyclic lactone autoinducer peptide [Lactobacillales bacterium]
MFRSFFSKLFKTIGSLSMTNVCSPRFILDEPEMPKSMIEK